MRTNPRSSVIPTLCSSALSKALLALLVAAPAFAEEPAAAETPAEVPDTDGAEAPAGAAVPDDATAPAEASGEEASPDAPAADADVTTPVETTTPAPEGAEAPDAAAPALDAPVDGTRPDAPAAAVGPEGTPGEGAPAAAAPTTGEAPPAAVTPEAGATGEAPSADGKPGDAKDGKVDPKDPKKAAKKDDASTLALGVGASAFPLGISASLTQSVGQGTFIPYRRWNPEVTTQLTVTPMLRYWGFILFASGTVNFEWTQPDNFSGRRLDFLGDPSVGLMYSWNIAPIWTTLQFTGGVRVPLSHASLASGQVGAAFGGVTAFFSTPIGISLFSSARLQGNANLPMARGYWGFNINTKVPTVLESGDTANVGTCLARQGEDPFQVCGGIPSLGQGSFSAGAMYNIWRFAFSANLGSFVVVPQYWAPQDQYTSEHAYVGMYPTVFTSSSASVTFRIFDFWFINGGISSFQPLMTTDGRWPRFPLWDFISPSRNLSNVFVGTRLVF